MSTAARELLIAFDPLPEPDRDAVIGELLLRHPTGTGGLPDAAFEELAEELFLTYDTADADFFSIICAHIIPPSPTA